MLWSNFVQMLSVSTAGVTILSETRLQFKKEKRKKGVPIASQPSCT